MPLDLTDDKSTLVQVMAWCCQATNHYLSQCWPRYMSPNDITRPQWVNLKIQKMIILCFDNLYARIIVMTGSKPDYLFPLWSHQTNNQTHLWSHTGSECMCLGKINWWLLMSMFLSDVTGEKNHHWSDKTFCVIYDPFGLFSHRRIPWWCSGWTWVDCVPICKWFSARLRYLQWISNRHTAVLL